MTEKKKKNSIRLTVPVASLISAGEDTGEVVGDTS
jgi:hypothetical protein